MNERETRRNVKERENVKEKMVKTWIKRVVTVIVVI